MWSSCIRSLVSATAAAAVRVSAVNSSRRNVAAVVGARAPVAFRTFSLSARALGDAKTDASTPAAAAADSTGEAEPSSLFIANVPWTATEAELKAYLESLQCGPISSVRLLTDKFTGRSKGIAYADCAKATVARLVQTPNAEYAGRPLRFDVAEGRKPPRDPREARPPRTQQRDGALNPPSKSLFVGNVAYTCSEDSLRDVFGAAAVNVRLAIDRETQRPRGYAFVEFASVEDAQAAFTANDGANLDGRAIYINFAAERVDRPDRPERTFNNGNGNGNGFSRNRNNGAERSGYGSGERRPRFNRDE